jgi:hypothetical protein
LQGAPTEDYEEAWASRYLNKNTEVIDESLYLYLI